MAAGSGEAGRCVVGWPGSVSAMIRSVILVAPPDHRWATLAEPVQPEDLLTEHYIIRESTSGTLDAVRHGLERRGLSVDDLKTDCGVVAG